MGFLCTYLPVKRTYLPAVYSWKRTYLPAVLRVGVYLLAR